MTKALITLQEVRCPVANTGDSFVIRRIFCVGQNYAAHAVEMGQSPERETPIFFTKFAESYVPSRVSITYPPMTEDYHHEIELVVALSSGGLNITAAEANEHIFGYAVGFDMTRRDLQASARKTGAPWDISKNFAQSAPLAPLHLASETGALARGEISLRVNDELRQKANLSDMIWSVPELLAILSQYHELRAGDIVMTGTPAGVGPVLPGDRIEGCIDGLTSLEINVVASESALSAGQIERAG